MSGFLEPVAHEYGVPYLACRGFVSLTALAEAADRLARRETVILYCGDHDPSGLEMDRDLADHLEALGTDAEFRRVALTSEQIDRSGLIPQPTKAADSRAAGDAADGSWELDALAPAQLIGPSPRIHRARDLGIGREGTSLDVDGRQGRRAG